MPARLMSSHQENVDLKLSKMGFFANFLYTFTMNCVTTGARNMPIEYALLYL